MKALVIGSNGCAHALAWKLAQSPGVTALYSAPGNYGTNLVCANVAIPATEVDALAAWAKEQAIDLTVVASAAAAAYGVVDAFREQELRIVGPIQAAARLQTSRAWAKAFMSRHDIPTAPSHVVANIEEATRYLHGLQPETFPLLLTADGPIDGAEVALASDHETALIAARRILAPARHGPAPQLVIEAYPDGFALSVQALSDGVTTSPIGAVRSYRRAFDGDQGPITPGMGAYTPVPGADDAVIDRVMDRVIRPVIVGMAAEGTPFTGVLCAEVVLGSSDLQTREVWLGFGDIEAQVQLPRWEDDLYVVLDALLDTDLGALRPFRWSQTGTCGVVLASEGYPGEYETGYGVLGLGEVSSGIQIFHINTRDPYQRGSQIVTPKQERVSRSGLGRGLSSWLIPARGRSRGVDSQAARASGDPYSRVITAGGPVLTVVGRGRTLAEARAAAYHGLEPIVFTGSWSRHDIGALDPGDPTSVS
jgi:phosphoribosylamine---glycine ligase